MIVKYIDPWKHEFITFCFYHNVLVLQRECANESKILLSEIKTDISGLYDQIIL